MKFPAIAKGNARQWLRCRRCGNVAYYDYIPYSLSNPILDIPCGHGLGDRDYGCDAISPEEAASCYDQQRKEQ